MNEIINVRIKNLTIKVDETYFYCETKNEFEFKISIKAVLNIVKFVNRKILGHKEGG